jgi:hypothetical protein
MDMKRLMLICFLVSMLVDREKNEVVISEIVFGMIPG